MEKEKNIFEIKDGVLIKLNNKYLSKVVIPEEITEIGAYAFYACKKITSINIPESVKIIKIEIVTTNTNLPKAKKQVTKFINPVITIKIPETLCVLVHTTGCWFIQGALTPITAFGFFFGR